MFQYISCCSLSLPQRSNMTDFFRVSIHLMLQFIPVQHYYLLFYFVVSIHLMLQFILLQIIKMRLLVLCFNTSHVVVYHQRRCLRLYDVKFQYISCCSLSFCILNDNDIEYSFNTSHVVVYRKTIFHSAYRIHSFNTSHVVVYLPKLVRY